MWYLSSSNRVEPTFSIIEGSLNHWTARDVPILLFIYLFCLKCLNFSHWKLFQIVFCVPLTYSKLFVTYCRFPYFKAPKDAIDLFVYSMPHSKTAISPKNSSSFYRQMVLATKIWTLGLLIAVGESLPLCSFQWTELGNICMSPHSCIHMHIYCYSCIGINLSIGSYSHLWLKLSIT